MLKTADLEHLVILLYNSSENLSLFQFYFAFEIQIYLVIFLVP